MYQIKMLYEVHEGHAKVRVFVRQDGTETWALAGHLTFRIKEWFYFCNLIRTILVVGKEPKP